MSEGTSRPLSVDSKPIIIHPQQSSVATAGLTFLVYPETSPTPSLTVTRQPFTELLVILVLEQSLERGILTQALIAISATTLTGMLPTLPLDLLPTPPRRNLLDLLPTHPRSNLLDILPTHPRRNLLDLAPSGILLALVRLTAHLIVSTTVLTPVAPILALNLPRAPRAPSAVNDIFTS
jgi:hypothetical protein